MSEEYIKVKPTKFQVNFPNNEACEKHLVEQRWKNGFECPQCGHNKAWYLTNRKLFDCKKCRFQTGLTAGTIFHGTRTPLIKWYQLINLMATSEHRVSASEAKKILRIRQYRTAWLMAHKVRKVMVDRNARYRLAGLVEVDGSFFGIKLKRKAYESKRKSTLLCAVSTFLDRKGEQRLVANMQVVNNVSENNVQKLLNRVGLVILTKERKQLLETIRTEGWKSYNFHDKELGSFKVISISSKDEKELIRYLLSFEAGLKDIYCSVSEKHLQSYLSEVCYRFNHRFREEELFDFLLQACISTETITCNELIAKKDPQPTF